MCSLVAKLDYAALIQTGPTVNAPEEASKHAQKSGIWTVACMQLLVDRKLVIGSVDEHISILSCGTAGDGQVQLTLDKRFKAHSLGVLRVYAGPQYIVSSGMDEFVKIWDYSGHLVKSIKFGSLETWSLAVNFDTGLIASGSLDGIMRLFPLADLVASGPVDISQPTPVQTVKTQGKFILSAVMGGSIIACGSETGQVTVINAVTSKIMFSNQSHVKPVRALAISSDGKFLATGSDDSLLNIYELEYGDCMCSYNSASGWILSVSFVSNKIVAFGTSNGKVLLYDLAKRELMHTFSEHSDQVWSVCTSADWIYAASDDGNLSLYKAAQ